MFPIPTVPLEREDNEPSTTRLLRLPQVLRYFPVSRSAWWAGIMIGQDRALDTVDLGEHFKWVPFDLGGHRATDHQAGFAVVVGRTDHQGRTVPRLWIEFKPHDVAGSMETHVTSIPVPR